MKLPWFGSYQGDNPAGARSQPPNMSSLARLPIGYARHSSITRHANSHFYCQLAQITLHSRLSMKLCDTQPAL